MALRCSSGMDTGSLTLNVRLGTTAVRGQTDFRSCGPYAPVTKTALVYEECRLLGYKRSVRTSQETHNISATDSSQLMLCKI
jgi:hypothetical protein